MSGVRVLLELLLDVPRDQAGQFESFLVINRPEEFAAAVNDRLSTIDFKTRREIIRAILKRTEIHEDEIVVVLRVDPAPGFNTGEGLIGAGAEQKCVPDPKRRNHPALRRPDQEDTPRLAP